MTKKIIISLFTIAAVLTGIGSATAAYFSSEAVLGANTFSTGTVKFGTTAFVGGPINMSNLTPGETVSSNPIGVNYVGTINADLYVGMKATAGGNLLGALEYSIDEVNSEGEFIRLVADWQDISDLFFRYIKVEDNLAGGSEPRYYKIRVHMRDNAGDNFQNIIATDTLIIKAVQHGFEAPTGAPQDYEL